MLEWIEKNEALFGTLFIASVILIVISALIAPAMILRIPKDYFNHDERPQSRWAEHHHAVRLLLKIGRNVLGVVLIIAGVIMLVAPGQGLLTIVVGVFMISFPRKYELQKWIVSRARVLRAINWFRRKRGVEPLVVNDRSAHTST